MCPPLFFGGQRVGGGRFFSFFSFIIASRTTVLGWDDFQKGVAILGVGFFGARLAPSEFAVCFGLILVCNSCPLWGRKLEVVLFPMAAQLLGPAHVHQAVVIRLGDPKSVPATGFWDATNVVVLGLHQVLGMATWRGVARRSGLRPRWPIWPQVEWRHDDATVLGSVRQRPSPL